MKAYPIYQVDAFTDKLFGGNPAAVCPLEAWLPTYIMQQLAMENNLSETAFFVQKEDVFEIRWFTPETEIDLAGHPTLATAFVIFNVLKMASDTIYFESKSGTLIVEKKDDLLVMNFPSRMPVKAEQIPAGLLNGFNVAPMEVWKSRDYLLIYPNEADILALIPNFSQLNTVETLGIIVSAPGKQCDFVSRFFVPNSVIGEDPVTGSAHATLIPYWHHKLNKNKMTAQQLSKRGGKLWCEMNHDRVSIAGKAVIYMKGEYYLSA
ncbi:PhzF family phenazine biosynthesis protein [Hydrotalea sp.]|uniref:PhzF family phenazine biosynthesis protein n=1 Tax=Hydrotalea sp. TaxID=2881279 RepID=UPI0026078DE1|nr:PhzF family phenazine biosynthesis protein [Hydrotalea sp.]